jgi:hypothetical protein
MTKGRQARKASAVRRAKMPPAKPVAMPPATPGKASVASASVSKTADLASDYRYVLSDLKRLGILAAASFAVLVVLALLIR